MPAMLNLSSAVMLDVVVAAFMLEATFWLAEFFETGRSKHGVLFGVFAAGACLTKGNGLAVLTDSRNAVAVHAATRVSAGQVCTLRRAFFCSLRRW